MIDLHIHLDGSISKKSMPKLAKLCGYSLPENYKELVQTKLDCESLNEYLNCFEIPVNLLQTSKTITFAVKELIDKLAAQGIIYAEIRFAPLLHLKQGLTQEDVVKAAIEGLNDRIMPAQLILCCMRNETEEINKETIKVASKYLHKGVCAIDLAGAEKIFKTENFKNLFEYAKKLDVPYTIHAGEADDYTSVDSALSFGTKRIGHGIHAIDNEKTINKILKNNITLELCPTSNYQTKAINSFDEYPLKEYLKKDVKATINTDNVTVSNTSLKLEYELIRTKMNISKEEVYQLLLNAIDGAFLSDIEKEHLRIRMKCNFSYWYYRKSTKNN